MRTWNGRRLGMLCLLLGATGVGANERHFTYTYESAVLPAGVRELEVWSTGRVGKEGYFAGFDERLEFETGLTDRLQTSLYLNLSGAAQRVGAALDNRMTFGGISNEWKYKLLDPVADALGLALYGEVTVAPTEAELEAKLILDKRMGALLLAANLIVENDEEFGLGTTKNEFKGEVVAAATYFFTPHFAAGLELRNTNVMETGKALEFSALFAGPVVSYSMDHAWVALTLLPQLPALKVPEGSTSRLVLTDHEKFNARLLFSLQI